MAQTKQTKIQGVELFEAGSNIGKIRDLKKDILYSVIKVNSEPTKFKSYKITISEDGLESELYVSERLYKDFVPGRKFAYNGMMECKSNKKHSYHSFLWSEMI